MRRLSSMKITSREGMTEVDGIWTSGGDGPWRLDANGVDTAFALNPNATGVYWIGYADGTQESFVAKYCGKAVDQPLRVRLKQHIADSTNARIKGALAKG